MHHHSKPQLVANLIRTSSHVLSEIRRLGLLLTVWAVPLVAARAAAEAPRIGLVYATKQLESLLNKGEDRQLRYRQAIEEQGGTIVVLAQTAPPAKLAAELATIDGVVLPGGIDIDPKNYGEERHAKLETTDEALDRMQFAVLRYAKEHELPVLGICLGHQTINVFYGGTLYQDLPSQLTAGPAVVHRDGVPPLHLVNVVAGSQLAGMLGTDHLDVTSYHHQGIKRLAPGFTATAHTADGLVEAIEHQGKPFILGVQFHPEKMLDSDPRVQAIFKRLVAESRETSQRKTSSAASGPVNVAADKELPAGKGLAAAFPADSGIGKHPDVLFADGFESGDLTGGWDEIDSKKQHVFTFPAPGMAELGAHCLRVEAHLGQDTGGGPTKWFASAPAVFVRFYTRFAPDCDYVHHFVTLRANKGLRGGDKWSGFGSPAREAGKVKMSAR